jgi:S-formylglutathione hydrolase FrmB
MPSSASSPTSAPSLVYGDRVSQRQRCTGARIGIAFAVCACAAALGAVGVGAHRSSGATSACRRGWDQTVSVPDPSARQGRRQVFVHHPAGPDRADIPVLYLLHGFPGDGRSLFDAEIAPLDTAMCRAGVPFVVAVPDGSAGDWDTEWGDDSAGRFAIESQVVGPVIEATEGGLRRTATRRAIVGYSMGGYGAAALALRHPDLYSQVGAFGGYFRIDDPDGVFGADGRAHAPDQLVSTSTSQRLRFFLAEGAGEDTPLQTGSIRGEADRFAAILRRYRVTVVVMHPPGGHDTTVWDGALPSCVRFLAVGWRSESLDGVAG